MRYLSIRSCAVLGLLVIAESSAACVRTANSPERNMVHVEFMNGTTAKLIARLPVDTESITFARGPFVFDAHRTRNIKPDEDVSLLSILQHAPTSILPNLRGGAYANILSGANIVIAFEGARRFRAPLGVGMATFEGCQALIFGDAELGDIQKLNRLMEQVRADATGKRDVMGHEVFLLSEKFEEQQWNFFIAQVRSHELLLATDLAYLEDVLARFAVIEAGGKRRYDALSCFDGWKYIDPNAPFWSIRRYDASAAVKDPSSAIGVHPAAVFRDPSAVGVTMSYGMDDKKLIKFHYLTLTSDSKSKALQLWTRWRLLVPEPPRAVSEVEGGVIRLDLDVGDSEAREDFTRGILGLIGHIAFP